jgi:hypothetical protein
VAAADKAAPALVAAHIDVQLRHQSPPGEQGNVDDPFLVHALVDEAPGELLEIEWAFDQEPARVRQTIAASGVTPRIERRHSIAGQRPIRPWERAPEPSPLGVPMPRIGPPRERLRCRLGARCLWS